LSCHGFTKRIGGSETPLSGGIEYIIVEMCAKRVYVLGRLWIIAPEKIQVKCSVIYIEYIIIKYIAVIEQTALHLH
jgi:hypothetical protein